MTLVSETKNAVIFLGLKSGACYFFGRRKMSSAEHLCSNKRKLQGERLQTKIAGVKIYTCNQT